MDEVINKAEKIPTQPTAAEVVEACRVALEGSCEHIGRVGHYPGAYEETEAARDAVDAAIDLCARWKEANGGK